MEMVENFFCKDFDKFRKGIGERKEKKREFLVLGIWNEIQRKKSQNERRENDFESDFLY